MISISPVNLPNINSVNSKNKAVCRFSGADVSEIILKGDKALNENKYNEALNAYQQALDMAKEDVSINKKLGKAYYHLKDYNNAEANYKIYLSQNSQDAEAWIELGEAQRQKALYKDALESFKTALNIEPANDLARRSILETENNILACYSPDRAYQEKQVYSMQNLQKALKLAVDYLTPEYMKDIASVNIKFGETAAMGGTSNIAQYENWNNTITLSSSYKYAAPQVIAAYLVHESVHAKDNDPYTSVREEQDAYEIATKFWIKHSNGVQDPEMDYAADLYKQSPSALKNRVEEIYTLRDPDIAQTSPNHPPKKIFHFNKTNKNAATQSLKKYDYIA